MISITDRYHLRKSRPMSETATAKLFKHGRSQAVRLPKEFRLPGTEVRVRRIGRRSLLRQSARSPALSWDWPSGMACPSQTLQRWTLLGRHF
jgi:virulence-associated protein VagC